MITIWPKWLFISWTKHLKRFEFKLFAHWSTSLNQNYYGEIKRGAPKEENMIVCCLQQRESTVNHSLDSF